MPQAQANGLTIDDGHDLPAALFGALADGVRRAVERAKAEVA